MSTTFTLGMADAKTNFSRITADMNRTGIPVTVFKNNKLWVEICPLAEQDDFASLPQETKDAIAEVEEMPNDPNHVTYKTADSLFAALDMYCP